MKKEENMHPAKASRREMEEKSKANTQAMMMGALGALILAIIVSIALIVTKIPQYL